MKARDLSISIPGVVLDASMHAEQLKELSPLLATARSGQQTTELPSKGNVFQHLRCSLAPNGDDHVAQRLGPKASLTVGEVILRIH